MKTFSVAILSVLFGLLAPNVSSALEIRGELTDATNELGRQKLDKEFAAFVKNEFVSSIYCQQGWGDGTGPARMQKACGDAQVKMLKEISEGIHEWMFPFVLTSAKIEKNLIRYSFYRELKLNKNAPLSCTVSIDLVVNKQKVLVSTPVVDLYCDH
jgi:hypothetical protein